MIDIEKEKETLTNQLQEQYSRNVISMEEYERLLDYINKIETKKEAFVIEKIIAENSELTVVPDNEIAMPETAISGKKHLSMFSWRTSYIKPVNGYGGEFTSLFGTNRIIVDSLPKGKTTINVKSIFGLTEIIVSKKVKIINKTVPVFSGIFAPPQIIDHTEDSPELHITGKAVFGNITIIQQDGNTD